MRILISHDTVYRYNEPPHGIVQTLRLTPRNHDSQYVAWWRIDISADCQLDAHEDAFGNLTHTFSIEDPIDELTIHVEGDVDTEDAHGIVRGADRALSAEPVSARDFVDPAGRGDRRLRTGCRGSRPTPRRSLCCMSCSRACTPR